MSNSYRHAFKATATLSSAQLIEAVFSLIRAKVIAILLGPVGIAMNSIFVTTLSTVNQIMCVGLPQSAVRDISQHASGDDCAQLARTLITFRKIMLSLAFCGFLLMVLLSRGFSLLSFGEESDYTLDFIILAVGLFAMVLYNCNVTILQGTHRLAFLARTTILASLLGLLIAVPCFYLFGLRGVSIAVSASMIMSFAVSSYHVNRVRQQISAPSIHISLRTAIVDAKPMIRLGFVIMLSTTIINLFTYSTNILIRYFGSLDDVGFYQAAMSMTSRNFAILSAVMAADFYPRLSSLINRRTELSKAMSEQGEVLLLAVGFVVSAIIVFAPVLVPLLFDTTFADIVPLVRIISFSFLFRVIWLTVSYVALAKGDKYTYLKYDALIGNGLYFVISIVSYLIYGLIGLGFASIIGSIVVSVILSVAYRIKYGVSFETKFYRLFAVSLLFGCIFIAIPLLLNGISYWLLSVLLLVVFGCYTIREINSRTDFLRHYITRS